MSAVRIGKRQDEGASVFRLASGLPADIYEPDSIHRVLRMPVSLPSRNLRRLTFADRALASSLGRLAVHVFTYKTALDPSPV